MLSSTLDKKFSRKRRGKKLLKPSYLIFCEGETEKYYFKEVKDNIANTIQLKQLYYKTFEQIAIEMKKYKKREQDKGLTFDFIYCVFDNNNLSFSDYQKGVKEMKKNKIELIYSNKSFEVWFLMHFSPFNRKVRKQGEYETELKKYLPNMDKPYKGIFSLIQDNLQEAILNAQKVNEKALIDNPEKFYCEPYTDVWKILQALK